MERIFLCSTINTDQIIALETAAAR